jgi:hypothetical protein
MYFCLRNTSIFSWANISSATRPHENTGKTSQMNIWMGHSGQDVTRGSRDLNTYHAQREYSMWKCNEAVRETTSMTISGCSILNMMSFLATRGKSINENRRTLFPQQLSI